MKFGITWFRRWHKPLVGNVKCNIDVFFFLSFFSLDNKLGFGICIRDELGAFVLAKMEWFPPMFDLHVGEALGLFFSPQSGMISNLEQIDGELDSKRGW